MEQRSSASIFISYRRSDSPDTVKLLYERLRASLPKSWAVFYDHRAIPPGEQFPQLLREKVTSADVVLVVIGPAWLKEIRDRAAKPGLDYVREEVRLALEAGHRVIPVTVVNARKISRADLEDYPDLQPVAELNSPSIRPEPDFDTDLNRLVAYLEQIGPGVGIGTILDGKYRIVRELGAGGMGIVYAAEQLQPRRTVAIKLVKPGMDSREVLARFDAERQALAVMDHPNIARVLDAGMTAGGRPWFAMDYVKGKPITQYCDEHKLAPDARLELFGQVCEAIQHAHQKGIIHRDIKPTNVLVEMLDGKPVPRVIDFGLAKALGYKLTNMTLITALETRVGTLEYSSPEQAAGRTLEIDTRTDVYSLGALLYELLAGEPPFRSADLLNAGEEEMRRVIREVDPPLPSVKLSSSNALPAIAHARQVDPSRLARLLRGELDWIAMKALDKDPRRRYETANALGRDVSRYLTNEPVDARPPGRAYLLKKFIRRNRGPVAAGTAILLLLCAGLIGTLYNLNTANNQRRRADQNALMARQQTQLALESLQFVLSEIESGLRNVAGTGAIRRRLLDSAIQRLERVSRDFASAASIDRSSLLALNSLGDVVLRFGGESASPGEANRSLANARAIHERALEMAIKLAADAPTSAQAQDDLSVSLEDLGEVQLQSGQVTEALRSCERCLEIRQRLAAAHPTSIRAQRSLVHAFSGIGRAQFQGGQFAQALQSHEQGLAIIQQLAAADPTDARVQRDLYVLLEALGEAQLQGGQVTEALQTLVKGLEICQKLAAADPTGVEAQRDLSVSFGDVGEAQLRNGQFTDALRSYEQGLEIRQQLAAADPNNIQAQSDLSHSFSALGDVQLRNGLVTEALRSYEQGLEISQQLATADPTNHEARRSLSGLFQCIGDVQLRTGAFTEAVRSYEKCLAVCQQLAAADPTSNESRRGLARSFQSLGDAQFRSGQVTEAFQSYGKGLEIAQELAAADPTNAQTQRDLCVTFNKLGDAQLHDGQITGALQSYGRGLKISQKLAAAADPTDAEAQRDLSLSFRNHGEALFRNGQVPEALRSCEKSREISQKLAVADPTNMQAQRDLSISLTTLGDVQLRDGQVAGALRSYEKSLEIREKLAAADSTDAWAQRDLWMGFYKLGTVAQQARQFDVALAWHRKALDKLESIRDAGLLAPEDSWVPPMLEEQVQKCQLAPLALGEWQSLLEQPPGLLPVLLDFRGLDAIQTGRVADAIQAAEKLRELETATDAQLYNCACVYSLASTRILATEGEQLAPDQVRQRSLYIAEALASLRDAVAAGWDNFDHMRQDSDLAPLRDLPEFKAILNGK